MLDAIEVSDQPVSVTEKGVVICMFGAAPVGNSRAAHAGSPWLLGSDRVAHYARPLIEDGRRYVEALQRQYPLLFNYVDARNRLSMKWLNHLGFTLADEPVPFGINREPFYYFERRSNV